MKYIFTFIFTVFVCFIIWFFLIYFQMGKPSKMSQWVYDAYEKKIHLAENIKNEKIIIVAGSNALFGVNSKMIEKHFNKPVLNYGVNAGIELPLTLYMAKKIINRNDLVIMPLEYPMYSYNGNAGVQMIDFLISREPELFWKLTLKEMFNILWKIELKRVLEGYFDNSKNKIEVGLYGYNNIDNSGDQINNNLNNRLEVYFKGINTKPEKYAEEFNTDALAWEYLDEFINWCKNRNVRVVFMPTTLMKNEQYFGKDKWYYENIDSIVSEKGYNFAGKSYDYMYDKKYYFDTNFHLIDIARSFRTKKMIEDLEEVIK